MYIFHWFKLQRMYHKQKIQASDKSNEILIEKAFRLYSNTIDISDGEHRAGNGFFSKNLSDAMDHAENLNIPYSKEINFMIWAIYIELHKRSIQNFKKGIMTVSLSELNHHEVAKQYIKACLKAEIH